MENITERPTFVVRVLGDPEADAKLIEALLEVPTATDEELARIEFRADDEKVPDARLMIARAAPTHEDRAKIEASKTPVFVALQAETESEPWEKLAGEGHVHLTTRGVETLRAAVFEVALERANVPVDRARRAKRPYAIAVIAGAALVSAAEGFLPGAAAFVVITQAGAISSLHYLYTGKWLARTQALALVPAFAAEAAGGSLFLLAKSFLPPTGVADVAAAAVAASMTISMLGAIAFVMDQGYSIEETEQLKTAFKKMRARTKAERKAVMSNKRRWTERAYWEEVARRVVFSD